MTGNALPSEATNVSEAKRVDVFIPKQRMGEFLRTIEGIQAQARKLSLPPWEGCRRGIGVRSGVLDLPPTLIGEIVLQQKYGSFTL